MLPDHTDKQTYTDTDTHTPWHLLVSSLLLQIVYIALILTVQHQQQWEMDYILGYSITLQYNVTTTLLEYCRTMSQYYHIIVK